MIRIFYFIMLFLLPLYALSSTMYTVKLAVYKNEKALNKQLKKFSPAIRKTIIIEKIKKRYKVKTLSTKNKKLLDTLLPAYKKVFPDASIHKVPSPKIIKVKPKIEKKSPQENNSTQKLNTFHRALQDKTFYLCPNFNRTKNKKFLIEIAFKKTTVTYTPILGKVPPMSALYKIEDNKLFLYQKELLNPKIFSLLETTYFKYHLISSWVGEKKVKSLRYYFNLNDAKAYLELH